MYKGIKTSIGGKHWIRFSKVNDIFIINGKKILIQKHTNKLL